MTESEPTPSDPDAGRDGPGAYRSPGWSDVVGHGLGIGLLLALLRAGVFFAMERFAHGSDLARTELRLAAAAPFIAATSAGTGLLCAFLLRPRSTPGPRLLWLIWLVLASLFVQQHLSGAFGDPSRQIGWHTDRGYLANQALLVGSLALVAVLRVLLRHCPAPRPRLAAVPLLLLVIGPLAAHAAWGRVDQTMIVRDVVRELPVEADLPLEIVARRDDVAPRTEVITPSLDYEIDGADMPALVLPPPASVRLPLDELDGTLWLSARAGIDSRVFRGEDAGEFEGTRVRFQLSVNGEPVFDEELPVRTLGLSEGKQQGSAWLDATGDEGIPVRSGDVLELATTLLDANGEELLSEAPLVCGFGGLTLERRSRTERAAPSPETPNIVLVVMDTQRADRLSAYGYERETSPRITALAERGVLYEHPYSTSSWTWPSTASILTGRHPQEHGVESERSCYLASALDTLPEALQRAGYTTAAFSTNPLIVPSKNFDQGFESFEHGRGAFRQTALVMPAVLEWLEAVADHRFFLYLQLTDPHVPHVPLPAGKQLLAADVEAGFNPYAIARAAKKLRTTHGRTPDGELDPSATIAVDVQRKIHSQYDACVWTGDHYVGRIVDQIGELGLEGSTVFAYTSDHGEEIFEHGLAEHGKQLHSELVRVPLVLAGPGIPSGMRVTTPVSNRHLAPTLARIGGTTLPGLADALDLGRPAALAADVGSIFFSTEQGWWNGRTGIEILGLRRGDWVLHFAPFGAPFGEEPREGGDLRLFHLGRDPGEREDLSREEPEIALELKEELLRRAAELAQRRVHPGVQAGEATLEMLHDIGYLGD